MALKKIGYENLTGIDVSEEMLNQCRLADTSLNLILTDIATEESSCYLNSFDLITSFRFFTNADHNLKLKVLPKLQQFLKPNGILIVNFHQNSSSILGRIYLLRNFILQKKIANVTSERDTILLFKQYGFELVETRYYSIFPRFGNLFNNFEFLLNFFMISSERIYDFFGLPRKYKQAYIHVFRKL